MPILAEVYNLGTPEYYAVAVVKIRDDDSELIYLKRRKSCHSGALHCKKRLAGFHLPNSPCTGIIKSFLSNESLVSDIPAEDGKTADLFYSVDA
jgi:hypothetical protein